MKYRLKHEVEAIQWFKGVQVDLADLKVVPANVEITYSRDQSLYYCTHPKQRSDHWLSVEIIKEKPADLTQGNLDGYLQIKKTKTGEEYWRKALPFAFWSVKADKRRELNVQDEQELERFKDYASMERWKQEDLGEMAYLLVPDTKYGDGVRRELIQAGDYVVNDPVQGKLVINRIEFEKTYEQS